MTVAAAAKIFAVAIPMVLVGVLHAPAQVLSSAQAPLGSITALQDAGQVGGKAPATPYALALKVTDTDKREIEAKASVRATPEGVDASPTPSDEGRTIWRKDATVQTHTDSCRETKTGEKPRLACADRLTTASAIANAAQAYDSGRAAHALELYRKALSMPGGPQLRVPNSVSATLARLAGSRRR
jgi:hypothetical protein